MRQRCVQSHLSDSAAQFGTSRRVELQSCKSLQSDSKSLLGTLMSAHILTQHLLTLCCAQKFDAFFAKMHSMFWYNELAAGDEDVRSYFWC